MNKHAFNPYRKWFRLIVPVFTAWLGCQLSMANSPFLPAKVMEPAAQSRTEPFKGNEAITRTLFEPSRGLHFTMKDVINSPLYDWPRTLLTYPLKFKGDVQGEDLVLTNQLTGDEVPFQLSSVKMENGRLVSATLNFPASLPSGGTFDYFLEHQPGHERILPDDPVSAEQSDKYVQIGNRQWQIRMPASQTINQSQAPAPVISMQNGKGWMGNNNLICDESEIYHIKTSFPEQGPLFTTCRVTYLMEDDRKYQADVTFVSGYPFVIMEESMEHIERLDNIYVEYAWTNFQPEYRWGNHWGRSSSEMNDWLGITEPVYTNYNQEDPHWTGMGWVEDPSEEMVFYLIPFAGNAIREQVPYMSFWEPGKEGNELGVFVYDFNKWHDNEYGIWQTSRTLAVTFRFTDDLLYWKYPLSSGTRSTAISLFPTELGERKTTALKDKVRELDTYRSASDLLIRYTQMLKQHYFTINLNKVKHWQLSYDKNLKRPDNPFQSGNKSTAQEFYRNITSGMFLYYPLAVNGYPGVHGINHRVVYGSMVEGYLKHYPELSDAQRKKVEALFLVSGYINSQEDMNAIRSGLSGTPNMAADGWCVPAQMAFLFPEHPMAGEWLDFYEKEIELNGLFYTRPDVKTYESQGGRWTESLPVYNWAYMRPTSFSNIAGILKDGKNRWATPYFAERGDWFTGMLTAPVYNPDFIKRENLLPEEFDQLRTVPPDWKPGDPLSRETGFERHYPAHGAHGHGTTVPPFAYAWQLAHWMRYYDPMVAEHLFWLAGIEHRFESHGGHTDWLQVTQDMYEEGNNGTNPHLESCKYTGHGIVLRSGVGEPDEVSLHLNQIDKGPNYRWGHQGQGGNGTLYFYAGGKIYTGHEEEANGDFMQNSTDQVTNFGVIKNNTFTNIGPNELTAPIYDLEVAQFGELLSDTAEDRYAWPEYVSRSALLVGTDYFLLYDETGTNWRAINRFSWFIARDMEYPRMVFFSNRRFGQLSTAETISSRGFYRDSDGSSAAIISPREKEIQVKGYQLEKPVLLREEPIYDARKNRDNPYPDGIYEIRTARSTDVVFRRDRPTVFENDDLSLNGKTGVIRRFDNGKVQMALVNGTKIGTGELVFEFSHDQLGWSAIQGSEKAWRGKAKLLEQANVTISGPVKGLEFYVNGKPVAANTSSRQMKVTLPAGAYYWEMNHSGGTPRSPQIERTAYLQDQVKVYLKIPGETVPGSLSQSDKERIGIGQADVEKDNREQAAIEQVDTEWSAIAQGDIEQVNIEISLDGGKTWSPESSTGNHTCLLERRTDADKIHVRAIAVGQSKKSKPSLPYPVYFETEPPHYPEGLMLKSSHDRVECSWGKVLGVTAYKLYRRKKGEERYDLIYTGLENHFTDKSCQGVVPPFTLPGNLDNLHRDRSNIQVYEYAVAAVSGLGEGEKGPVEDTDPASWRNWYPRVELKFIRRSSFWKPPYVYPDMVPEKYYPE